MIQKITLKNFQSHKDSVILLDDGFNIFSGQSDSGKSAIIRALIWVFTNKPSGDSFRSIWAKKEPTEVEILLDTGDMIRRIKGKSVNSYFLNDREYKAMGQNVPEEIQEVLNIDCLNYQSQHESPFLLSESAGEVARTLNRLVNLEIMDKALIECNSERLKINREMERYSEEIDNRFQQLSEFDFLDIYKKQIDEVEKKAKRLTSRKKTYNSIVNALEDIDDITDRLDRILLPDDAEIENLTNIYSEYTGCIVAFEQLENICNRINDLKQKKKSVRIPDISDLENYFLKKIELQQIKKEVKSLTEQIKTYTADISTLGNVIRDLEEQMPNRCPLCNQKI